VIFIKDLEIRLNNGKRGYMWAEFECPKCGIHIERMKHQGKAQNTCPDCAKASQKAKVTTHGDRYSRLYRTWINMRARCNNPKEPKYPLYGGRGITVCKEWENYLVFKAWALANGYTDELTIDRVDVNKNYTPDNCVFITNKENAGKDKVSISLKQYKDVVALIATGMKIAEAYTHFGFSRTAYYNAKERYKNVS